MSDFSESNLELELKFFFVFVFPSFLSYLSLKWYHLFEKRIRKSVGGNNVDGTIVFSILPDLLSLSAKKKFFCGGELTHGTR